MKTKSVTGTLFLMLTCLFLISSGAFSSELRASQAGQVPLFAGLWAVDAGKPMAQSPGISYLPRFFSYPWHIKNASYLVGYRPKLSPRTPSLKFADARANGEKNGLKKETQIVIDPGMHAFLTDYLIRKWRLGYSEAESLATWVLHYSELFEVDPLVQMARVLKESGGRHHRISSRGGITVVRGRAGEIGFSQIAPFWIGKSVEGVKLTRETVFDPEGNILAGIALYKRYERTANDHLVALSRYNRPGARRPNSYAYSVDRIYRNILSEYLKFRVLQPTFYSCALTL